MSESVLWLLRDIRRARKHGSAALAQRQRAKLAEIVVFARANSPYYRELYHDLPERVDDPALLPVTTKKELMECFDDWVTDREATIEKARTFVGDPDLVGGRFLAKYLLTTNSGTTGRRGIFLFDDRHLAVNAALLLHIFASWLTTGEIIRILGRGMRTALVFATGGHFVAVAFTTRIRGANRWLTRNYQIFSVHTPLSDLVAQLNRFRPIVFLGYATVMALLADEEEASNLRLNPVLVIPTAEGLAAGEYDRIARAFGAKVRNLYAADESGIVAHGCEFGWLHVDGDWTILEPVDVDYRPIPPGEHSHTVLLSNLANRVQPILRYDLGDSILQRPGPCPCGDTLPAIRVQGRSADVLTFPTDRGEEITIAPLAFATLVERIPEVELFQIVQSAPTSLRVRLHPAAGADPERVWQAVHAEITHLLADHELDHIMVERGEEPPQQSPGGKYRTIIPLT